MTATANPSVSRRRFLQTAGATALVATGPAIIIPGRAQPKTLKILTWKHVIDGYNDWLQRFAQEWGERNDTKVILDQVLNAALADHVAAEAAEQRGHDLVDVTRSPEKPYPQLLDLSDVYQECERRFGRPLYPSFTYKTQGRRYIIGVGYSPTPVIYRQDLWDAVGFVPDTWDDVFRGGRRINLFNDIPVGLNFNPEGEGWLNVSSLLYSFGGLIQDADNRPALKSPQTLESLKYAKNLHEQAMTDEVLSWTDGVQNNRAMVAGEISLTLNLVTIPRTAENLKLPIADQLAVARPPQGPARRASKSDMDVPLGIWKFAENIDGAKQFLVDLVGDSRQMVLGSKFYMLPNYPNTVPDLAQLLAHDPQAQPSDKYRALADAGDWTIFLGEPGYWNEAIGEVWGKGLVPTMFVNVFTDKMTPEEALTQADQELRKIYQKWQALGKL